jgi:hypothetical protein
MTQLLTKKRLKEGTAYVAARDCDLARLFQADGVPPLWARKPCFSTMNTLRKVKSLHTYPSSSTLFDITEAWRPFRSVAARMLWHHYLSEKARNSPIKKRIS